VARIEVYKKDIMLHKIVQATQRTAPHHTNSPPTFNQTPSVGVLYIWFSVAHIIHHQTT